VEEEARRARRVAERLAGLLAERYGVRRVVLAGSLARGEYARGSDIDLAVEELPDEVFFRAGADLDACAGGIPVDLVPLESAVPAYREAVAREGIVLHDGRAEASG
jgi:predicted nucleotidyltransferase